MKYIERFFLLELFYGGSMTEKIIKKQYLVGQCMTGQNQHMKQQH